MKKSTKKLLILGIIELFLLYAFFGGKFPIMSICFEMNGLGILIGAIAVTALVYIPIYMIKIYIKSKKEIDLTNFKEEIDSNFEVLYQDLYVQHISDLEVKRKKARLTTIIVYILFGIVLIGYMFGEVDTVVISKTVDENIEMAAIISMILMFGALIINAKTVKAYKSKYKGEIVATFIDSLKKDIDYKPEDKNSEHQIEEIYRNAGFDDKSFNRFYADDNICGNLDEGIYTKLSDICVKQVTGSGKSRSVVIRFEGLFAVTNCKENFSMPVKIVKNAVPIMKKSNLVELDNEQFERYFDIYCEDKILAVRILTHDVMECLIDFYEKYKIQYEIVFKDNVINLRFHTGPMFEPKIFGNSMDKELLYVYYLILKFVIDLTKKVNKEMQNFEI